MPNLRGCAALCFGIALCFGTTERASGDENESKVQTTESKLAQLMVLLKAKPVDAVLRDVLDDVWEKYRSLQGTKLVDDQLRLKVIAFVKEAWLNLERVDPPRLKRPLDSKKSSKWNRENQLRPVRRYDGEKFDERTGVSYADFCFTGTSFEKPFRLAAIGRTSAKFSVRNVNNTNILLVTPEYGGGKTYAVELPANLAWDHRVNELSMLAEVQSRAVKCDEYSFDVVLRPLILRGLYRNAYGSGEQPIYFEQIDAF